MWQGRFVKVAPLLVNKKFDLNAVALFTSVIGEIGDNCFTHNAPGWIDIPGCWFEWVLEGTAVRCMLADRGRGILASLQAVRPSLQTHREAMYLALTERVSGRAPEERGNGLKFVMEVLSRLPAGSFSLQSGDVKFSCFFPLDRSRIEAYIETMDTSIRGTYCEIFVQLSYAN